MIYVMLLLAICSLLGIAYNKQTNNSIFNDDIVEYRKSNSLSSFIFIAILVIMILFSGLRTVGNDTGLYVIMFQTDVPDRLVEIKNINWTIGANPLFSAYRIIIKSLISTNAYVFIFITAILVTTSYLLFIKSKSVDFGFTLFLLIAFTVYAFTMAAIKQTLATAIAIWCIPLFVEKNKKILPSILILVAMLIHPYVLIYFATPFFTKNIWDKKTWLILIITVLIGIFFTQFIEGVLDIAEGLGDSEYKEEHFSSDTSVNIFRVLVYLVPPILSFLYKNNIKKINNKFYFACINLSIISSCFMTIASFGGAILLGRMAAYFDIINCLTIVIILRYGVINKKERSFMCIFAIIGYIYYYYTFYTKNLNGVNGDWFVDFYEHISLWELF